MVKSGSGAKYAIFWQEMDSQQGKKLAVSSKASDYKNHATSWLRHILLFVTRSEYRLEISPIISFDAVPGQLR